MRIQVVHSSAQFAATSFVSLTQWLTLKNGEGGKVLKSLMVSCISEELVYEGGTDSCEGEARQLARHVN